MSETNLTNEETNRNNKILLILNGFSGAGKDELSKEICRTIKVPAVTLHASDKAKEALRLLGWDGVRDILARKLLADLTEFCQMSSINEDMIAEEFENYDLVIFHERSPKQIQKLVDKFSPEMRVISVLVSREGLKTVEENRWNIEDYSYDFTVLNDSTLQEFIRWSNEFAGVLESLIKGD